MRPALVAFALAALSTVTASATTIGFGGLQTSSPFVTYAESGFDISAISGSWDAVTTFGSPAPFIQFTRSADEPTITAEIEITAAGSSFTFDSVDLYSSITPIPYTFTGFLNSQPMFTTTGTVPNTFGSFATASSNSPLIIDTLQIILSNPATECCPNPVGLDNIVMNEPIPEPATLFLLGTGLVVGGLRRRMRRQR